MTIQIKNGIANFLYPRCLMKVKVVNKSTAVVLVESVCIFTKSGTKVIYFQVSLGASMLNRKCVDG